jgi:hypothetical protein
MVILRQASPIGLAICAPASRHAQQLHRPVDGRPVHLRELPCHVRRAVQLPDLCHRRGAADRRLSRGRRQRLVRGGIPCVLRRRHAGDGRYPVGGGALFQQRFSAGIGGRLRPPAGNGQVGTRSDRRGRLAFRSPPYLRSACAP